MDPAQLVGVITKQLKAFQPAFEKYEESAFAADDKSSKKQTARSTSTSTRSKVMTGEQLGLG
jgi:hypothetical protein